MLRKLSDVRKAEIKTKIEEPELKEIESMPESDNSEDLEEQMEQIRTKIKNLETKKVIPNEPVKTQVKPIIRIVTKDLIPTQRINIVKTEEGDFEVITIEEALEEILTILREA